MVEDTAVTEQTEQPSTVIQPGMIIKVKVMMRIMACQHRV